MSNIILTNDLVYDYVVGDEAKVRAINDMNFNVEKGEFVAIIGHNGSGKSTLAKLLNGILHPTKGIVLIKGMNTTDHELIWEIRQNAGMVFQNPDNQIVATIVEEDIAFGPENLGVESTQIRLDVDKAIKDLDLEHLRKKQPHQLSGGQKQRVAIAGILAMKPECIIFDEPTAMLDPAGRKEVMSAIKRLNKEGITVLHITHFMEETVEADRIVVMHKGSIELQGKPREVFSNVNKLQSIGLDVPQATLLANELIAEGIDISKEILTVDEMVREICQYL